MKMKDHGTRMIAGMIAGLVFIGVCMMAAVTMCFLMTQEYKSQITTLLKHQQKLILMVKARDSVEAEAAVTRMETPNEPSTPQEPLRKPDDNVVLAGNRRIRLFGLNPQDEADLADDIRNGGKNVAS